MYLRGILLCVKEDDGENIRLLYNRSFPTAELKAKQLHESYYIPFAKFVNELSGAMSRLAADSKKLFLPLTEAGQSNLGLVFSEQYKPIYALRMPDDSRMWPIVMIEQGEFMAIAVPLVEAIGNPAVIPLHKIPVLAPAYELLVSILEFVSQNAPNAASLAQHRLKDLTMSLTVCCPFGLITSTDLQRLRRILKASMLPGAELLPAELDTDTKGTPFFRPVFPADKENISALLVERISCVQTADAMMTNISGCCWLCAELTSASPLVSLPVGLPAGEENSVQIFISPHSTIDKQQKAPPSTLMLTVTPPSDWFPLFIYETRNSPEPPVFGLLLVQGQQAPFKLTLQLKPSARMKSVEMTDLTASLTLPVQLCLSSSKTIGAEPLQATHGDVGVDSSNPDATKLVWRIGNTKLPVGDKPATMKGSLSTTVEVEQPALKRLINELHVNLRFSWRGGLTSSGISLRLADAKVQPARLRPRFALESRGETVSYRIYNTA